MKKFTRQAFFGKDFRFNLLLIFAIFAVVGMGCMRGSKSSTKPIPDVYFGEWKGNDGSILNVRGDSSGDFRSGGFKVDNGTVEIDDSKKELSVKVFGFGKTLKIDQEPIGNQMKLGGVTYLKNGATETTTKTVADTGSSKNSTNPFGGDSSNSVSNNSADDDDPPPPVKRGAGVPDDDELNSLVQDTLQSFADAVESEDFTDFRDDSSNEFKRQYTADACKNAFQVFINAKDRVVPVIRSTSTMTPNYSPEPATSSGKRLLTVNGSYSTSPSTKFELQYVKNGSEWKMIKIRVMM